MHARVVRFTDVDSAQVERIKSEVESGEGPPEGMPSAQMRVVVDGSQNTATVIMFFDSEEDMRKADEVLGAMDASDTPGTRASVDQGEVLIDAQTP